MKVKINKTDKEFSNAVRMAADYICQCCGKQSQPPFDNGMIDNAHNVSRSVRLLRFDPRNTACLCRACHMRMTQDPHEHVSFFKRLDSDNYQFVREIKNDNMTKLTKKDEESIFKHYKKEVERIKSLRLDGKNGNIKLEIPEVLL